MENLIKERYYRKTQKLILKYIDTTIDPVNLKLLWDQLTLDNAKSSYEKANKLISPPCDLSPVLPVEIGENVMLKWYYYVFYIFGLSLAIGMVGCLTGSSIIIDIAKCGLIFSFAFSYAIAASM